MSWQTAPLVTAANESLCGGGGVDGAVHAAAGASLVTASRALAPCPAGNAKLTPGFKLRAKYVIHAVGPVYRDLASDTQTLSATYEAALSLAADNTVGRIAFPSISTGAFGFPAHAACEVAIATVMDWLRLHAHPESVVFCCYEQRDAALYRHRLEELGIDLSHK